VINTGVFGLATSLNAGIPEDHFGLDIGLIVIPARVVKVAISHRPMAKRALPFFTPYQMPTTPPETGEVL